MQFLGFHSASTIWFSRKTDWLRFLSTMPTLMLLMKSEEYLKSAWIINSKKNFLNQNSEPNKAKTAYVTLKSKFSKNKININFFSVKIKMALPSTNKILMHMQHTAYCILMIISRKWALNTKGEFTQYPFFVHFRPFFYVFASPWKSMRFSIRSFISPYTHLVDCYI